MIPAPSPAPSKQPFWQLAEHEPVAFCRIMVLAENKEVFVRGPVGIGGGKEHREQIDEGLAAAGAELAPKRYLPAVAVALRQLLSPGIDHDGQRNLLRRQQVGERPHVLQRPRNAALDAERL